MYMLLQPPTTVDVCTWNVILCCRRRTGCAPKFGRSRQKPSKSCDHLAEHRMCFGQWESSISRGCDSGCGRDVVGQSVGTVFGRRSTAPAVRATLRVATMPPTRGTESADTPLGGGRRLIFQAVGGPIIFRVSDARSSVVARRTAECWCSLYCRHYQDMLPAEGLGQTRGGPKIPIEQMFSDYVQARGLSNWKFWIVSLTTVFWHTEASFDGCRCHWIVALVWSYCCAFSSLKYRILTCLFCDIKTIGLFWQQMQYAYIAQLQNRNDNII